MNDTSGTWNKALQASSRTGIIVTFAWLGYVLYLTSHNVFYPLSINGMKVEIPTDGENDDKESVHNETSSEKAYMTLYFLPFGDFPLVNTSDSPTYEIVYFIQASGCIVHAIVHGGSDTLFFALLTLVCGQFEALISSLKIVGTSKNYSQLLACIHHHQQLLRTVEMFNALYSPLMCVHFFNAMMALCTFAFEASKMERGVVKIWGQAQFFLATTIQVYMFCCVGSRLSSLSLEVADSSYESEWIDKPKLWKQSIAIIIMRGQKPIKVSGGPFYVVSNETFLALMQLSLSYYTVLRNVQVAEE